MSADITNNPESGTAGKPGEARPQAAPAKEQSDKLTLTPDGIAKLLQSEFNAGAEPEPEQTQQPEEGGEVQPAPEEPITEEQQPEGQPAGEQTLEPPQALTDAISQWEENGGGELPPALQGLVERRIGKLTSQREVEKTAREAAEAKLAAAEAELQTLRTERGQAPNAPASVGALDEGKLNTIEATITKLAEDAANYLDQTATDEEVERVERYMKAEGLDEKGLKRRVRELNSFAMTIPEQRREIREFKKQESAALPLAKQQFPWLFNPSTPEYQEAQEVLAVMPELKVRTPAHLFALGVYILGLKEFDKLHPGARPNAKLKPANGQPAAAARPAVRVPPKVPTGGSAVPGGAARSNGKARQVEALSDKLSKKPTAANVTELLKEVL